MKKRREPIPREFAEKYVAIANKLPLAEFDIDDILIVVEHLRDGLHLPTRAAAKSAGRPPLSGDDYVHIWAVIEAQWRMDRSDNSRTRLAKSIERKLSSLPRKRNGAWRIVHNTTGSKHLEIKSVEAGRKYYRRGALLVKKMHPMQRQFWESIVAKLMARSGTKPSAK